MKRVTDFSKYTDDELRNLLIENAKPSACGMSRVVREIQKKYHACDREMMLWFIVHTYNGELYAPDNINAKDARELRIDMKRREVQLERERNKPRPPVSKGPLTPAPIVMTVHKYSESKKPSKKPSIVTAFKKAHVKAVEIADTVYGVQEDSPAVRKIIADYPECKVVIV